MLTKQKAEKALKGVFPHSKIKAFKRFEKGLVNKTYSMTISNPDKELIIRIYPKEEWKVEKEAYLYNLIRKRTNVPVPKVYKVDGSKTILKNPYIIISKIGGKELSLNKKNLVKDAGSYIAKIHSIKFNCFGWIINKDVYPKFKSWSDFVSYDLDYKIKRTKIPDNLVNGINDYVKKNKSLLDIKSKPCLLHKDYHKSHILVKNNKINGIIDIEWSVAGHNELDIVKSLLWMFKKDKKLEKIFLDGYKKYGVISKEFNERRRLYELIAHLSALNFAYQLKNKKWYNYNLKKMEGILKPQRGTKNPEDF